MLGKGGVKPRPYFLIIRWHVFDDDVTVILLPDFCVSFMIAIDPEPYVHFDFLRMLGKGGTHLPTLGYGPINTTLIYQ